MLIRGTCLKILQLCRQTKIPPLYHKQKCSCYKGGIHPRYHLSFEMNSNKLSISLLSSQTLLNANDNDYPMITEEAGHPRYVLFIRFADTTVQILYLLPMAQSSCISQEDHKYRCCSCESSILICTTYTFNVKYLNVIIL